MVNTSATDFGRDTSCTDSLKTGRFSTGARLVAEACFRRLITPRGTLIGGDDEANYGLDLLERIGSVSSKSDAAALPGQIQNELLKDERLTSVDVTVIDKTSGPSVSFEISIFGQTDVGPFSLVLAVSDVTVDLLGLQAE